MRTPTTWYLVLNKIEARILHELPGPHDALPDMTTMRGQQRSLSDVYEDRPVRSFASAGGGRRSAVEPRSDPLEEDSRAFMRDVQGFLEKEASAKSFDQLVVVASPDALGTWRAMIADGLKSHVKREIVKNLVQSPDRELVTALHALLRD